MKFYTDLDLRNNKLKNVVFGYEKPANPKVGHAYFDQEKGKFGLYEGTEEKGYAWSYFATEAEFAAAVEALEAAIALKLDAATFEAYKEANDAAVASKVAQSDYDTKVAALEAKDEELAGAIADLDEATYSKDEVDGIVDGLEEAIAGKVAQDAYDTKVAKLESDIDGLEEADRAIYAAMDQINTNMSGKVDSVIYNEKVAALEAKDGELAAAIDTKVAKTTYEEKMGQIDGALATKVETSVYEGKVQEIENTLAGKADQATTLAGYGITDAYTKAEVDGKLSSAFHYKGTVQNYADLPTEGNVEGDVYNIVNADAAHGINAGDNVAWVWDDESGDTDTGHWDILAGVVDLSSYAKKSEVEELLEEVTGFETNLKVVGLNPDMTGSAAGTVEWTVAHTHGEDVVVALKEVATNEEIMAEVIQNNNSVTIRMNVEPEEVVAAGTYKVVIMG